MLLGNDRESSPPLSRVGHFKSDIDQQTFSSFILYYRLAIMQDSRDNEKKTIKNDRQLAILKICHGLSLCESSHFVLYAWSSFFALFLSYVNITTFLKFKMAA